MSGTDDIEDRKDEQAISSPPALNRVSKTLHDHGEDTSSASESGPSSHGPATGGRKTVSSMLKDALGSLDALIENSNHPKERSNKIKSNVLGAYNLNILYNHYGKHFDTHSSNFSNIQMDSTDLVDIKISTLGKKNNIYFKIFLKCYLIYY